jgi:hypothetical protein
MMKWTEKVSDLCMSFFKKTLDIIQFMNNKGDLNNTHIPTLFVHHKTQYRYVINSSDEIFKDVRKFFLPYLISSSI